MDPINKAIDVLNSGGVILYQTDTIWGLGCLTDNVDAIKKIYSIKGREFNNKLILILENDLLLKKYVSEVPEIVWDIIDQAEFQPTIVYQNAINLPDILIEQDGTGRRGIWAMKDSKIEYGFIFTTVAPNWKFSIQ